MDNLADAGFGRFKISVVMTRDNVEQLDDLEALAARYGAESAPDAAAPVGSGRRGLGRPAPDPRAESRHLYRWLLERPDVLTGDSFFHLSALGEPLDGLNLCGAGRVVCLIDPVGDVYACPFVIHDEFRAGNVRDAGLRRGVARRASCSRRCANRAAPGPARRAAPTTRVAAAAWRRSSSPGSRSTDPDPECVFGHGEAALARRGTLRPPRRPTTRARVAVRLAPRPAREAAGALR